MLRKLRSKIFVLIGEDVAAAEQVVLRAAGNVGHVDQRAELVDEQIAFFLIASFASGDAIHPRILAAAGFGQDMIA
ncbi:MAG: hypothetical protein K0S28_1995 [Paucimonas sp.]|nr:hypothetical protein [Paucimonas sp.]